VASQVEEGLSSLNVQGEGTIHNVQLTQLPCPHSRGVRRLRGFMPTIVTAGLSSLSQITYPAHSSGGPTAVLLGGFMCVC
jgi:hypothetical protein